MEKKWYQADSSVMTGDVSVAEGVSIWHNATLRADTAPIRIGRNSNVQDNVCIHAGDGYPVEIGENVSIGHGAILHGCTIADNTIIGMGAIVLNGAHIGMDCMVGAGALVTQGMQVADGSLVLGSPAKRHRMLTAEEIEHQHENALHYVKAGEEQLREKDVKQSNTGKMQAGYERLATDQTGLSAGGHPPLFPPDIPLPFLWQADERGRNAGCPACLAGNGDPDTGKCPLQQQTGTLLYRDPGRRCGICACEYAR